MLKFSMLLCHFYFFCFILAVVKSKKNNVQTVQFHNSEPLLFLILLSLGEGSPGGSNILQLGEGQEKTSAVYGYTESQEYPYSLSCPLPGIGN